LLLDEERIKRAVRSGEAAYEMWMAPMGIGTIPAKMAGGTGGGEGAPSGEILCSQRACAEIGD
jgi:hypothetical protein